jgi:putative endonuclease
MTQTYSVYILSCADDSYYTGLTRDLDRRLAEHKKGRGARWTQRRRPVKLVFSLNDLRGLKTAQRVEAYIKTLSRKRKEALIAGDPNLLALVEKRTRRKSAAPSEPPE